MARPTKYYRAYMKAQTEERTNSKGVCEVDLSRQ